MDRKMPLSNGKIVIFHVMVPLHVMVIMKFTKNSGQFSGHKSLLLASKSDHQKAHFSPNKEVNKCNVCLYEELENGGVNGNKNCDGGVPDGAEDNDCPAYADAACFTSAAIHTGSV